MKQKILGLKGYSSLKEFINYNILSLKNSNMQMVDIFNIMFENDNVFWETTDGNKIFSLTYEQAKENVYGCAAKLNNILGYGDKETIIGINLDNSIEWIKCFWAVLSNGYIPLLINKRLPKNVLNNILTKNKVKAVISDDGNFEIQTIKLKDLMQTSSESKIECIWADKVIFMSSGTSENVKLCVYNGRRLSHQIFNTTDILSKNKLIRNHYDGFIKQLTFLPFYHVFGFIACYLWFAFFGRTFVYLKSLDGETILNTIKKHKVTHLFAVPMLWEKIEQAAYGTIKQRGSKILNRFEKGLKISNFLKGYLHDWFAKKMLKKVRDNLFGDSIQFMISGGGAISKHTIKFFNGLGYHLANGYGMTEIGITSVDLSKNTQTTSIGKPFSTIEYKIENKELFVRGTSVANNIIIGNNIEDIDEYTWFATGDLAKKERGSYYLQGRKDDLVINSSGENINPDLLEKSIYTAGIKTVLTKIEIDCMNKAVLVVGINKYSSKEKCKDIRNEIIKKLHINNYSTVIDEILFTTDPIIKDDEIKINRKRISRDILNKKIELINLDKIENYENLKLEKDVELMKKLKGLFGIALDKNIDENQSDLDFFFDLGGTSLGYFSLLEGFRKEFNIIVPLNYEKPLRTIDDFYYYIKDNT